MTKLPKLALSKKVSGIKNRKQEIINETNFYYSNVSN